MIVPDVNLLVYAVNADAPNHRGAKSWLESVLSGGETIGLTWSVLLAFLRLTTRGGIFTNPLSVEQAWEIIDAWTAQPTVSILEPGPRHLQVVRELLLPLDAGGNLTSDAHLAAVALEHRAELCSADNDFSRFPGLRWRNPLPG